MIDIPNDNVCFIVPSLSLGGQENAARIMANFLASRHLNVTVLTIYRFPHFHKVDQVIRVIDPPYDKSRGNKWWYYARIIGYLRRKIKETGAERIISYGDWSNILVMMACLGMKKKVFISDRASPDLEFRGYVGILRRLLYPKAHGIIAQTDRAAEQKRKMLGYGVNVKVIPNPIQPMKMYPGKKRKDYILGVGRHWHVKGLDRLIEAFASVNRKGYHLKIAGSQGPVSEDLLELVKHYSLDSCVTFLGNVEDMDLLYAECKIFVLPSRSEGFPNALIESMANGLACISFDCSAGPDEIITSGEDGILVNQGNIEELARQIQYLIDHEEEIRRIGQNALKIRKRLSLDVVGTQFMDFVTSA